MSYRFVRDEDNGMTSFARVKNAPTQTAPARATTYRVLWTWPGCNHPVVYIRGLSQEMADAAAEGLNNLAQSYTDARKDVYYVEEE